MKAIRDLLPAKTVHEKESLWVRDKMSRESSDDQCLLCEDDNGEELLLHGRGPSDRSSNKHTFWDHMYPHTV